MAGAGGRAAFAARHFQDLAPSEAIGKLRLHSVSQLSRGSIEGRVEIEVRCPNFEFKGIWVQLVTLAASWPAGKERRLGIKESEMKLSQPCVEVAGGGECPAESPISPQTIINMPTLSLTEGTHKFTFKLLLKDNVVPASFKSNHGEVQNHIVLLYASSSNAALRILDGRVIRVRGYLDISLLPGLDQPLKITQTKTKGMFSSSVRFQITLEIPKKGYVSGESILGVASIENQTGEAVESTVVELVQRTAICSDTGLTNRQSSVLGSEVLIEPQNSMLENVIQRDFGLQVPQNLMPSWESSDRVFKISYLIQLISRTQSGIHLKAETEIVVGTLGGSVDALADTVSIACSLDGDDSEMGDSFTSSLPTSPPHYSTLSSRTSSSSISALPPDYETAIGE